MEKIIDVMRNNPKVTQKQLEEITGLSRRGIEWNLAKLKAEGRIRRIGSAKGGKWEIAAKDN